MRSPATHGLPWSSERPPSRTGRVPVPPSETSRASGTVTIRPSANTNVSDVTSPDTHPSVQSPIASPLATA